ncbi:hypothetical protein [Ornithobacterium rhinotracheale]
MDNLRRSIRLLFADYCPDYILQTKNAGEHKDYINLQKFLENGYSSFSNYSLDEICNVFKKLKDDWFIDPETKKENYFHILNHFNSKVLSEQNNEPFVIYKHLLKWRHLSHYTGEDFLTTSFFAYSDLISQRKRSFFAWRGTSFSNNKRLRQVLEKGLAENHFHLKGSGPVFVLSWLNLMNNPTKYDCKFKKLEEELSLTTKYSNANIISNKELKILVYKAAYIRFKLFCLVNQISTDLDLDITKPSNSDSSFDLLINIHHLSREINALKYDQGHKFIYNNDKHVIDYAIPQNIHHSNLKKSYVFYGERKLMYQCFQKIFDNDLEFKNLKGNKLMLPKQMVLDNIVWLLAKIRKYGISIHRNEVNRLEKLFENLYYELYSSNMTNEKFKEKYINHITYFNAWKLRGDDPYLYQTNIESDLSNFNLTYWDRCRINEWYPKNKNVRENIDCKRILQAYHFNKKIKKRGREIKQFKITHAYAALVEAVQRKFMHEIKSYNISIETNPTSNYLIGTFERYAKHPITKFFNLGLEINSEKIKDCPQLSVSINTDDQGIFSTSLENEYALMAIALEKEKNELGEPKYSPSMIYEYLEKIRIMGIEQSFSS